MTQFGSYITSISAHTLTLPLTEPFGVAARTAHIATNILCIVRAGDDSGLGSCAPVQYVTGETSESVVNALGRVSEALIGRSIDELEPMLEILQSIELLLPTEPAARAAIEMAVLDISAKKRGLPLWTYYGSAQKTCVSDLTIPIVTPDSAGLKAKNAWSNGFRALKIKVGDANGVDIDLRRLEAVCKAAPDVKIRIDANQAFTAEDASVFIKDAAKITSNIELLEQPVKADDLDGFCFIHETTKALGIDLFADESAQDAASVLKLLRTNAIDGINVKIMKSGLEGAAQIAALTKSHGAKLMIGCMLEANLSLTASCALACGSGSFDYIDLDSQHLLAANDLYTGGFMFDGPQLFPETSTAGWGITLNESSKIFTESQSQTWQ